MAATQKVSVTIATNEIRWMKARARRLKLPLSSLLSEAVRHYREEEALREAQQAFLATFATDERATREEMDALEAQWRA